MNKCKNILLVVLNFIIVQPMFANGVKNDQDAINQKSEDSKKQGKWIYFGKDRPETGTSSAGKVEEGKYIDDRKESFWIKYYTDGVTPKLKGEFAINRPEGMYYKFYPNGKLREKGTYEIVITKIHWFVFMKMALSNTRQNTTNKGKNREK